MSTTATLPTCTVRGSLHGGRAMCGAVIMSSGKCSSKNPCQHKVEPSDGHKTCIICRAKVPVDAHGNIPEGGMPCGH